MSKTYNVDENRLENAFYIFWVSNSMLEKTGMTTKSAYKEFKKELEEEMKKEYIL